MLQSILVALIIGAAALYMGGRWWRTVRAARRKDSGCGGDCCGH
jgi:hypothetical protein